MNNPTLFLLLVAFSLVFAAVSASSDGGNEEPLIMQVVDGGDVRLGAEHHFLEFKRRFGKAYDSEDEHDYRYKVFKANMRRARRHQSLDPSAAHGVTRFSDLTPSEFRNKVLGLRGVRLPLDANKAPILPTDNLPSDFDWRDHGAVTPVKNQVLIIIIIIIIFVCV